MSAPEPKAPPLQQFNVYWMTDQNTKNEWLGGSYDNISAVTIGCCIFAALEKNYQTRALVAVFDSTDTAIAFIGGHGESTPTQTVPAAPAPVLSTLQPDSAGNWNVEVHAIGQNFVAGAVAHSGTQTAVTTFISATEVSFIVPGVLAAGVYQVSVRNPDGQESNSLPFTAL